MFLLMSPIWVENFIMSGRGSAYMQFSNLMYITCYQIVKQKERKITSSRDGHTKYVFWFDKMQLGFCAEYAI